ncbi:hypothetical protein [Paraflavitalea soli]|uniref:hypothetical protein n=1 Tax=Paraflavitalea soli TaxID=2315862 RepID=UPI0013C4028D|nr:hypothetical protein [Paraflavitalea soli]
MLRLITGHIGLLLPLFLILDKPANLWIGLYNKPQQHQHFMFTNVQINNFIIP